MSNRQTGIRGRYREPNPELSFQNFGTSLLARAMAVAKTLQGLRMGNQTRLKATHRG
jgi:hypothetical protein